MKRSKTLIVLAGLIIGAGLGLIFWVTIGVGATGLGIGKSIAPSVGSTAPDFELESLSGERICLSQLKGTPVLINFWVTWCAPCKIEMPTIQSRYEESQPDLIVLAVNFDETKEEVQPYIQELGLTFKVLLDHGGEVQRLYRIRGCPSTYLVDRDGLVQVEHIGLMTRSQLDGYLSQVGLNK